MAPTLQTTVAKLMADYPIGSQEGRANPVVSVRLVDAYSDATWWLAEYCPEDAVAYCYVSRLYRDEWEHVLLDCLAGFLAFDSEPRIVVDDGFEPMRFAACRAKYPEDFRKPLPG